MTAEPKGAIDYSSLDLPGPIVRWKDETAYRARRRMYDCFSTIFVPENDHRVLDVGVTPERRLKSANFFEAFYPWKERITATSVEDASFLETEYPGLHFVRANGCSLPFRDREFDVVFSSAVLEHVGDRDRQKRFVDEILRVGKRFFLTTPNRWFPLDLHTALPVIHWAPRDLHQCILRILGKEMWASTDNLNLLSSTTLRGLFPTTTQVKLVRFKTAGLTSNLIVYGESGK